MKGIIFDSCEMYYDTFSDTSNLDTLVAKLTDANKLATSDGGVKFTCTHEIHDIPFARLNEKKVKGNQRVLKVEATVEGEVLTFNSKLMDMSLMTKETNSSTKYDVYRPNSGFIPEAKYKDLAVVGTSTEGKDVIILLHNTYNSELALDSGDSDEGRIAVKFEAHYDKAALDKVPVEVLILKESAPA